MLLFTTILSYSILFFNFLFIFVIFLFYFIYSDSRAIILSSLHKPASRHLCIPYTGGVSTAANSFRLLIAQRHSNLVSAAGSDEIFFDLGTVFVSLEQHEFCSDVGVSYNIKALLPFLKPLSANNSSLPHRGMSLRTLPVI